jgi:hypothetical protein
VFLNDDGYRIVILVYKKTKHKKINRGPLLDINPKMIIIGA